MSKPTASTPDRTSFAIPKAAVAALLAAQADAVTIGAYLTLAAHTDKTGQFSTAGMKAVRENLSIDKPRAEKALAQLAALTVSPKSADAAAPKSRAKMLELVPPPIPPVPLIYKRQDALAAGYSPLPGPEPPKEKVDREDSRIVRFVLPTFDEPLQERVWIGGNLVSGDALMEYPLRELKNCGDVAARLLLALYEAQDLRRWYGIAPCCGGYIEKQYRHWTDSSPERLTILAGRSNGRSYIPTLFDRLQPLTKPYFNEADRKTATKERDKTVWDAWDALWAMGFIYEAVCVLNRLPRNMTQEKPNDGLPYFVGYIDAEAELLYDLAYNGIGGPVSTAEVSVGPAYRQTITELFPNSPHLKATHSLAIVRRGQPAMIAGLFRLRYRVLNTQNAFIEEADGAHLDRNKTASKQLNYFRAEKKLDPIQ